MSEYSRCMLTLLTIVNQIKIYHWQTLSFPRHKATDELYSNLSDLVDKFIEVLNGILIVESNNKNYRITLNDTDNRNCISLINYNDNKGLDLMINIRNYLVSAEFNKIISKSTDLVNIRDEMLENVNKTCYLFSLN